MVFLPTAPNTTALSPTAATENGAGKRTRLSGLERRAQLLEVARELFATHGFHHISMEEIALAARVTKPVLYKHFPSKLDLYLAIIEDLSQALIEAARKELFYASATASPQLHSYEPDIDIRSPLEFHHIKAVIDAYVAFVHETGLASSLLFESDVTRDDSLRDKLWEPNTVISRELATYASPHCDVSAEDMIVFTDIVVSLGKHVATEMLHHAPENLHLFQPQTDQIARFAWRGIAQ